MVLGGEPAETCSHNSSRPGFPGRDRTAYLMVVEGAAGLRPALHRTGVDAWGGGFAASYT